MWGLVGVVTGGGQWVQHSYLGLAIDSPTMDTPTSTASTSTSSSAPITSTSPDRCYSHLSSSLIDAPYDSIVLFVPTAVRSMTEQEAVVTSPLAESSLLSADFSIFHTLLYLTLWSNNVIRYISLIAREVSP